MDPALQELIAEGAPDDEVAVLLRLADPTTAPPDVRLIAQFGNIATCRIRRGDIAAVRSSTPVRSVKAARLYASSIAEDEAIGAPAAEYTPAIENDSFDDGEALPNRVIASDLRRPPSAGLPTGKGVVVAHIDWGVDIAHPDFRLPDGRTRLLAIWDQRGAAFPDRPNRYGYGRIFNRDEINRALFSGDPYGALGYHPADFDTLRGTHGTHTLSIAAGNGRSGGPLGIAPDADLIFVHLSTYTAEGPTDLGDSVAYFEAVDFILRTVAAVPASSLRNDQRDAGNADALEADTEAILEQPRASVVINSSLGRHAGPHVGRTLVEQGLDAALREAPGRAFVHSAGNYYNRRTHASGTLRPGETHTLQMYVEVSAGASRRRTRSPSEVELWYPGTDRLAVAITAPDGTRFESVRGDQHVALRLRSPGDPRPREIGRLYHRLNDPNNGDNEAVLFLYKGAPAGIYKIALHGEDVADGRYHLWIERNTAGRRAQAEFAASDSRAQFTTGTICNGFRTIAVGAYDTHAWQQSGDVPETGRPLAPFSSSGPTRDGRQKPDLCAPGVQVLAARSCPRNWPGKAEGQAPPLLTRMSGTSMAAPHVTGTIALMFEVAARPLAIEETRRMLLVPTDPPPADASIIARLRIGSGFLNIEAAVVGARAYQQSLEQLARSPIPSTGQFHPLPSAEHVLSSREALQHMNNFDEINETETDETALEVGGYYPEYDPEDYSETDESGEDAEAEADESEANGYYPEYDPEDYSETDESGEDAEAEADGYYPEYDPEDYSETDESGEAAAKRDRRRQVGRAAVSRDHRGQMGRAIPPARRGRASPSVGFVLPLGGNSGIAPALSFPVGGRRSGLSVAVPLTGGMNPPPAAPPPAAPPPAAQAPAAQAPAAPPVSNPYASPYPDPSMFAPPPMAEPGMAVEPFMAEPVDDPLLAGGYVPSAPVMVAEPTAPEVVVGRYTFATDEESQWHESQGEQDVETDESDETFGERLVAVADTLAEDPRARTSRSSLLLAALLNAVGQAQTLSPLGNASGHLPSASELYNAFVHGDSGLRPRHRFREHYARHFAPVALPGSVLRASDLRPGDLVVRVARGENWGQLSVVAESRLLSASDLGGTPRGGYAPGGYVPVIENMPVPRRRRDNFARRVTGVRDETLPDTLVLRVRRSFGEGGSDEAESEEPTYSGEAPRRGVLARGAFGPAVREVQARLNRYSLQEVGAGRLLLDGRPLEEDGKFGPLTERAVRDFQMRQFPTDASQWDGIVGPRTWEKLDAVGRSVPAGLPAPPGLPIDNVAQQSANHPPPADVAALRRSAGALIAAFVPSDTGDGRFDEIAQDYGRKGTTCGFLCHWLLWRLGCADRTIVNRNAPNGYTYRNGQNISRIWNGGKLPFVRVLSTGRVGAGERPEQGDIVFIATPGGPATSEHVFVFLEEFQRDGRTFWRGADAGQRNAANQQCARYSERELSIRGRDAVVRRSDGTERTVHGWLSLANLAFEPPPLPLPDVPRAREAADFEESVTHTADLSDGFFAGMHAVAAAIQTQPQFLLAVMNSESGIRASAHNPNGHASGLIQFMPATLRGLGWTQGHEAFRQLSAEEQLPFVQRYYLPFVRQGLNSTARLYQATFLPATLSRGSEPETVLVDVNANDNAFAYAPNRGLDRRGDGRILVGDLTAFVERAKGSARWREAEARLQATAPGSVPLPIDPPVPVPVPPVPITPQVPVPPIPTPTTTHPLLRRGARGEAVRKAQTKLNLVHGRNLALSLPGLPGAPLEVDGIFGVKTFNAVVSFQQQAFPTEPGEWDGVIGPKTWAQLDLLVGSNASSNSIGSILNELPLAEADHTPTLSQVARMEWQDLTKIRGGDGKDHLYYLTTGGPDGNPATFNLKVTNTNARYNFKNVVLKVRLSKKLTDGTFKTIPLRNQKGDYKTISSRSMEDESSRIIPIQIEPQTLIEAYDTNPDSPFTRLEVEFHWTEGATADRYASYYYNRHSLAFNLVKPFDFLFNTKVFTRQVRLNDRQYQRYWTGIWEKEFSAVDKTPLTVVATIQTSISESQSDEITLARSTTETKGTQRGTEKTNTTTSKVNFGIDDAVKIGLEQQESQSIKTSVLTSESIARQFSESLRSSRTFTQSFTKTLQITSQILPAAPRKIKTLYIYPIFNLCKVKLVRFEGPNRFGQATLRKQFEGVPVLLFSHWGEKQILSSIPIK